ncbi:MAG: class I SAM-dependent methyltransferase [Burkholderiales bacterium]
MDWKHGYFAESGYTYGFYPEVSPARLGWIASLKGLREPGNQFRYIDMGCGQGLGLLILAAAYPDAEFVGIDFMPEHIAHARNLAKRAGLTNVKLIEGDFLALNKDPAACSTTATTRTPAGWRQRRFSTWCRSCSRAIPARARWTARWPLPTSSRKPVARCLPCCPA